MFNATYFTYDGVNSSTYGLMIADFDDNAKVETVAYTPALNVNKTSHGRRFIHTGVTYGEMPSHKFTIVKQAHAPTTAEPTCDIDNESRRTILKWLTGRGKFIRLEFDSLPGYYFMCVFTNIEIIYINGYCYGFNITANFDSQFAYGSTTASTLVVTGNGTQQTVTITNYSDVPDDYTYPIVTFCDLSGEEDCNIKIINSTDSTTREFKFTGLSAMASSETITVDNELKVIDSTMGGSYLSNFNKNWLRLRPGVNTLLVTINGSVTITCPNYALIGF